MASTQSPYSNLKSPPVMRSLSQAQGSSSSPYLPGYLFGGSPAPATQPGSNNNPSNYGHKMQHTPSHLNSRSSMSSLGKKNLLYNYKNASLPSGMGPSRPSFKMVMEEFHLEIAKGKGRALCLFLFKAFFDCIYY